jgi:hypothetical protein
MSQHDGRKGKETMAGLEGFNRGNPGIYFTDNSIRSFRFNIQNTCPR